jgi:hypothetical protein
VRHFHVSSSLNRASIQEHGLDWSRMGAAPGIAGSRAPEVEGCFLSDEEHGADYFIGMNNTGGPVDLWAVDDLDPTTFVEYDTGYRYFPGRIPPDKVVLVRVDIAPAPHRDPSNEPADSRAYSSSLSITFGRDSEGWSIAIQSVSDGMYDATATHLDGSKVRVVGEPSEPMDALVARCRQAIASG